MSVLKGNDVIIMTGSGANTQGGGTALAMMKSCEIEMTCDTIEVAPPNSGTFRTYMAGRRTWTITSNHLVEQMNGTSSMLAVGQEVLIQFRDRNNTRNAMYGAAICTEYKIVATRGNLAMGSFRFQGTGLLRSIMS